MAERGGQIGGADEHAVHALDRGDGLERSERRARLDLHQQADLAVGGLEIVLHPAIAAGARRGGDAADSRRRIAHGCHGTTGFLGILHVGHQDRLRADVEHALDQHSIVPRRPHNRGSGAARCGLQLREQARNLVGRVLAVEQDPIEAGIRHDLGRDVAGETAPQADLQAAGRNGVLERVDRKVHGAHTNCTAMPPSGPKSACSVSPFWANTTRVNEPASTQWPGSSATPCAPSLFASQATPSAGWPSTPAAPPVSSISELRYMMPPTQRRSTSIGPTGRPPTTMPAAAPLSATVSKILRGSWMRASTIAMAGSTYSVARSTSVSPTRWPFNALPSTKASSVSTRGRQ